MLTGADGPEQALIRSCTGSTASCGRTSPHLGFRTAVGAGMCAVIQVRIIAAERAHLLDEMELAALATWILRDHSGRPDQLAAVRATIHHRLDYPRAVARALERLDRLPSASRGPEEPLEPELVDLVVSADSSCAQAGVGYRPSRREAEDRLLAHRTGLR